jgi:TonB-linked SusC/RagA family outer membrane protein
MIATAGLSAANAYSPAADNNEAEEVMQVEQKRVSGTVTDEKGEAVIGANVLEKGTFNGVITDLNGKFSLSVAENATLQVSFLGYSTLDIPVKDNSVFDIRLQEDAKLIDEVVVVGYGVQKKVNLTGAVDQVKGAALENRPITSVGQALQGVVANLNISSSTASNENGGGAPGAKMSFNIRGITGLNGDNASASASPLIVIDGIQGGDINSVNPSDIESISVLKDAASAAIYGSSAPHGVVLITTKQGRKDRKPTVTYSNNFGWASVINLPKMMNSVDWAEMTNEAMINSIGTPFLDDAAMQRVRDYAAGKISETAIIVPEGHPDAGRWSAYDPYFGNDNIDWLDMYYKDLSFSQQHNAGISGGTESSTYYVGLGYNHRGGMYNFGDDSFKRYSFRGNLSTSLTKWLTANFRSAFSRGFTDTPSSEHASSGGIMHDIARLWPVIPYKNPDGTVNSNNYIEIYENGGRINNTDDRTVLTGEFVINPIKGWNTTLNYTFNHNNVLYERNYLTTLALDAYGNTIPGQNREPNYDILERESGNYTRHTVNAFSSYELELGDHYFKGMLGYTQESLTNRWFAARSNTGHLYISSVPTFKTVYGDTQSVDESRSTVSTEGVFGRINYGYKEKYLLELNARYDGSSRFLQEVRWKVYPGVSGAWLISKENFWEQAADYVGLLKLRLSYGSLGDLSFLNSDNFSYPLYYYPFYPSMGTTGPTGSTWLFGNARDSYLTSPAIINPALTWVTSTTFDVGADLSTFNNRFTVMFDWFRRNSNNIVGPSEQLPAVLGSAAPKANNASLETNGFEVVLGWRDQISDFSYGVKASLADSKTVVKAYPNDNKAIDRWYDGAVVGDIWGFETEGFFTAETAQAAMDNHTQDAIHTIWSAGDIKYKELDGKEGITTGSSTVDDPGDRRIIGNNMPRYTYGITLDAAWKGFDVSAFFQGIGKRDAWISSNYLWGISDHVWAHSLFDIHSDRWTEDNPNGYFPKYYFNNWTGNDQHTKNQRVQTKYLQDASYLRFKNLQVGYTFPQQWLDKVNIDKLRIYVSGENLATFTKMVKTIDPEFAVSSGKIYPLQRTWSVGLNLTF